MSFEPGLIDANVLVYAMHADAPQHAASRALRDQRTAGFQAAHPEEALSAISDLLVFLHVLPIPARTVEGWLDLLRRHSVTGGDVFDLQIVATMQANGIQRIYTFNSGDFEVFPELAVLTP